MIIVIWGVMKRKEKLKAYTTFLSIPFLIVSLVLTVLASRNLLTSGLEIQSKNFFYFQVTYLYIVACFSSNGDFRITVYLFGPLTLVAIFLVYLDERRWFKDLQG